MLIGAKPATSVPEHHKNAAPTEGAASYVKPLPCMHEVLFKHGCAKVMHSQSNRRAIWLLCIFHLNCLLCYGRLNPQMSQEDFRNAKIRKVKNKLASQKKD